MTHHVLMSEPLYYRIAYEINPWMHRSNPVEHAAAAAQWRALRGALLDLGVRIEDVEPGPEVPDMPFTANAGIVVGCRFLAANFRFPERQPEARRFARWFAQHGYSVERIHLPYSWEGEGDVLESDGRVFAGYGFRTEPVALDRLEDLLSAPVVRLELVDPRFYHLDTCLCPLGDGRALYYPPALSETARARLRQEFDDLIAVEDADALRFACNAVTVGDAVVLNSGCPATVDELERRGFRCVEVPTHEFIKAGGSVKCLVLTLDTFSAVSSGQNRGRREEGS